MSILARSYKPQYQVEEKTLAYGMCTVLHFFHVRSVIYDRKDNGTMITILDSTKSRDEIEPFYFFLLAHYMF